MKEFEESFALVAIIIIQLTISIGCILGLIYLIKNWKAIWK